MKKTGLVLIEIIVVLIIVGIIATLGLINYSGIKEETLDKEAKANLKLIQAAEKLYNIEFFPNYYPPSGSVTSEALINDNLKLSLPLSGGKWDYQVDASGTAQATRNDASARQWTLPVDVEEPCEGASCP